MTAALVTDTRYAAHTLAGHVEFAGRMIAIHELLNAHGLPEKMTRITPAEVDGDLLRRVHRAKYLDLLAWTETQKGIQLGPDTYVLPQSFSVARLSAGSAVAAVDAVLGAKFHAALSCARPPGHHATREIGMGFCLLSNIALAARHAQRAHGMKRIMIVDYDVHHGNGTQDVFYEDPDVLFVSTHQSPWYPGTGMITETGTGAGTGTTVNIPVPAGTGDAGFAQIYEQIVWPVARRFKPELILVSAGFDAHWDDPLGQLKLGLKGYDYLARQLMAIADELCDGKIVFALEGGYNLTALSHGVLNLAYALTGDTRLIDPLGEAKGPETDIQHVVEEVIKLHNL